MPYALVKKQCMSASRGEFLLLLLYICSSDLPRVPFSRLISPCNQYGRSAVILNGSPPDGSAVASSTTNAHGMRYFSPMLCGYLFADVARHTPFSAGAADGGSSANYYRLAGETVLRRFIFYAHAVSSRDRHLVRPPVAHHAAR